VLIDPVAAKAQIEQIREMQRSVMTEDVDFGVIPGTDKPSLLQPGAEILQKVFGLGVKMRSGGVTQVARFRGTKVNKRTGEQYVVESKVDGPGVSVAYTAQAMRTMPNGAEVVIAECEGFAGNDEEKWRDAPRHTLAMIAQKRAYVGAIRRACGASGIFTQDVEDGLHGDDDKPSTSKPRRGALDPATWTIPFGREKGKTVGEISDEQLEWYATRPCNDERYRKNHDAQIEVYRGEIERRAQNQAQDATSGPESAAQAPAGAEPSPALLSDETRAQLHEVLVKAGQAPDVDAAREVLNKHIASKSAGFVATEAWGQEQLAKAEAKLEEAAEADIPDDDVPCSDCEGIGQVGGANCGTCAGTGVAA
jgi:hypothetical protein